MPNSREPERSGVAKVTREFAAEAEVSATDNAHEKIEGKRLKVRRSRTRPHIYADPCTEDVTFASRPEYAKWEW
jgi:hypothetical protein